MIVEFVGHRSQRELAKKAGRKLGKVREKKEGRVRGRKAGRNVGRVREKEDKRKEGR